MTNNSNKLPAPLAANCIYCGPRCSPAYHNARVEDNCKYGDLPGENLAKTAPLAAEPQEEPKCWRCHQTFREHRSGKCYWREEIPGPEEFTLEPPEQGAPKRPVSLYTIRLFSGFVNTGRDEPVLVAADAYAYMDHLEARVRELEEALVRLRDCDWVITPHDRMDGVRDIARKALEAHHE